MKPVFATLCLLAFADPILAETPGEPFQGCIEDSAPPDASTECKALRAAYLVRIDSCMAAPSTTTTDGTKIAPPASSQANRARYLTCKKQARSLFHPFGH